MKEEAQVSLNKNGHCTEQIVHDEDGQEGNEREEMDKQRPCR